MLTCLKRTTIVVVPLLAVGLLFLAGASTSVPVPTEIYQQCLQAAQKDKTEETKCEATEPLWKRSFSDPIAYYTLWLTVFTGLLGAIGVAQWTLISRQIKLSADEFSATHRPKLYVQNLSITDKGKLPGRYFGADGIKEKAKPCEGIITVANGGDSVAFIMEWKSIVYLQRSGEAFRPSLDVVTTQTPNPIGAGVSPGIIESFKHFQSVAMDRDWKIFDEGAGHRMFFIGRVIYQGRDKIRRSTGFCREWDKNLGEGRWKPTNYTEYEYTY